MSLKHCGPRSVWRYLVPASDRAGEYASLVRLLLSLDTIDTNKFAGFNRKK